MLSSIDSLLNNFVFLKETNNHCKDAYAINRDAGFMK